MSTNSSCWSIPKVPDRVGTQVVCYWVILLPSPQLSMGPPGGLKTKTLSLGTSGFHPPQQGAGVLSSQAWAVLWASGQPLPLEWEATAVVVTAQP